MSYSGNTGSLPGGDDMIRPALERWRGDARFGERLAPESGIFLVLDEAGSRLLLASDGASGLARTLSDDEGRLAPHLRMADQIGASRLAADRPALVRLRLDRRGIATPTTCAIVRTALADGHPVLILAFPGKAPREAAPSSMSPVAAVSEPTGGDAPIEPAAAASAPVPAGGTAPNRFVWRSDAGGTLTQVSGPAAVALGDALAGRSWHDLSRSGTVLDAEGLLSALDQRRTFRAIPVTLVRSDPGQVIELEISGAPLARTGGGFGGFGLVRPVAGSAVAASVPTAGTDSGMPPSSAPAITAETPPDSSQADAAAWAEDAARDALESARSGVPMVSEADRHLSTHEHAAFREIARALGARFAGDEPPDAGDAEPADRGQRGAVMPFPGQVTPGQVARSHGAMPGEPDPAMVATLERLPTGVLVYRDDTILFANGPLLALAGYADSFDLSGPGGIDRLFRGIVPHARHDGSAPAILTRRQGGGLGVDLQHAAVDWDGAAAELLLVRDAASSEALRQDQATAMARDFTAYRSADASAALDVIEDGIAILDENDRILHLNRGAATLLRLDPREVVGAGFLSLFATESAVDVLAILHGVPGPAHPPAHPSAPAAPSEIRPVAARLRGGGPLLQIRVSPLAGTEGRRACAVIRDLATTVSVEADALDARRAADAANDQKSEFLAKVSHEIRTPIGGIVGLTDLMLNEQFGPIGNERYRDYLGDIRAAGAHVLDLVNDLLDLARIEAGHLDLTVTAIPLNDVVSRCVALLQPQAARDRIVVRTSFSDDLATLMADERSVRQAALNVIANAIAFTEAGGQVIVSTTMADRGEIALRVRDTGIGMTPDEVETAMQPFRQVDPSGSRKGTGLGLPLTKALVEANHGRFRIASRKNEGTLVEMLFPANAAAKTA